MKVIKIRTVEEAQALQLPPFPRDLLDEAHALQTRMQSMAVGRHTTLREIYALIDKAASVVEPLTVCSKGCAACCEIAVGITELEATYIARNAGKRMKFGVRSSPARHSAGRCPFLSESNECTVYRWRPFACRTYFAFDDPALCAELDVKHMTYNAHSNAVFKGSMQWLGFLNADGALADIRDFFGEDTR